MNDIYVQSSNGRSTSKRYPFIKSKTSLALFDFDGTITTKDSLVQFLIFSEGRFNFFKSMVLLFPVLFLYKLGIVPGSKAKETLLAYFFKGTTYDVFQFKCMMFARARLPQLIRKDALNKIWEHQLQSDRIVIVSASPENWVGEWAANKGLEFIATRLEVKRGKLTGRFLGKNCSGEEKVSRIKHYVNLSEFKSVYTYGDTPEDWPMLKLGTKINYKPFRV